MYTTHTSSISGQKAAHANKEGALLLSSCCFPRPRDTSCCHAVILSGVKRLRHPTTSDVLMPPRCVAHPCSVPFSAEFPFIPFYLCGCVAQVKPGASAIDTSVRSLWSNSAGNAARDGCTAASVSAALLLLPKAASHQEVRRPAASASDSDEERFGSPKDQQPVSGANADVGKALKAIPDPSENGSSRSPLALTTPLGAARDGHRRSDLALPGDCSRQLQPQLINLVSPEHQAGSIAGSTPLPGWTATRPCSAAPLDTQGLVVFQEGTATPCISDVQTLHMHVAHVDPSVVDLTQTP